MKEKCWHGTTDSWGGNYGSQHRIALRSNDAFRLQCNLAQGPSPRNTQKYSSFLIRTSFHPQCLDSHDVARQIWRLLLLAAFELSLSSRHVGSLESCTLSELLAGTTCKDAWISPQLKPDKCRYGILLEWTNLLKKLPPWPLQLA